MSIIMAVQFWSGLTIACVGSFYAGYQRGRRIQSIKDTAACTALVEIVERLGDEHLSGLGREIRDMAMKGLR
jgi:hypothetical protein